MQYTMIRVLGLFVGLDGDAHKYGFYTTVFVTPGTFEDERAAVRAEMAARMARHGVHVTDEGAFRTFCIMRGLYSVERDDAEVAGADGFSFFRMYSLRVRLRGALRAAWHRWRKPEYLLI